MAMKKAGVPFEQRNQIAMRPDYKGKGDGRDNLHCNKCGRDKHDFANCTNPNPDCNMDSKVLFTDSDKGRRWRSLGVSRVPFNLKLDGSKVNDDKPLAGKESDILERITKKAPDKPTAYTKRPSTGGGGRGSGASGPSHKKRKCESAEKAF